MEPTLFKYIFRFSWQQQLMLLALTLLSFPSLYYSLELPKQIVNDAIGGDQFPRNFIGFEFDQLTYLLFLSGVFLSLVGINGALKYYINVYKGIVGERMLRRLRYLLFSRVLRFPLPRFRRTSQGEIIAMISSEVETLGGFIGDALAQPAFQGGTLLTILFFMFVQDWFLGLAAIALYPLQAYFIPKLQRQVNLLAKERVRTVRRLSERIGESVSAMEEIHANDTSEWHRADFAKWVGTIYEIRLRIYKKKFFIKFLNNFLAQLTPFFFYAIGGYLVIEGRLTFGALVAVLAAYKDLSSPWKELLDWYQQKEDARIKYEQLVEQFQPPGMLSDNLQRLVPGEVEPLGGQVVVRNLTYEDEGGVRSVDSVHASFSTKEAVTVAGDSGSGGDQFARLLARLLLPTSGTIHIGSYSLATLPEAVTGRRLGFVGPSVALVDGTIADNLYYPLKRRPLRPAPAATEEDRQRRRHEETEAERSGNTTSDWNADWIDYAAAGVGDAAALSERALALLDLVDFKDDVFGFGLNGVIDPQAAPDLVDRVLAARRALYDHLKEPRFCGLIEPFDPDRFNDEMSVAENILFGVPVGSTFDLEHIGDDAYMREILRRVDLTDTFVAIGYRIAGIMVDLFRDVAPDDPLFARFSFISAEALPTYEAVLGRVDADHLAHISEADRSLLLSLPFQLIPARHRLGVMREDEQDDFKRSLLLARHKFALDLPDELRGAIAFFNRDEYNPAASVQDNILFGKIVYGRPQGRREVGSLLSEVLDQVGLRRPIIHLGFDYHVGIGGSRLSAVQRQKLAVARSLLKRPDLLILDHALAALEPAAQTAIMDRLLRLPDRPGLVVVQPPAPDYRGFDRVLIIEAGRIVQQPMLDAAGETVAPAANGGTA